MRQQYRYFIRVALCVPVAMAVLACRGASAREPEMTISVSGEESQLLVSPDGSVVVTYCPSPSSATLWDSLNGKKLGQITHASRINEIKFAPDGKTIATASGREHRIHLWESQSGRELPPVDTGNFRPDCFAFSPDGSKLLYGSDNEAILVDLTSKQVVCKLRGHAQDTYVNDAAFATDGKRVATAGKDATVRIWDANTGRELNVIKEQSHWVASVAFSPDGKAVAYCAAFSAGVWDLEKGKALAGVGIRNSAPIQFTADGKWAVLTGVNHLAINVASGKAERIKVTGDLRSVYEISLARTSNLSAVHISGPGGGSVGVLRDLAEEVFCTKVAGAGPGSRPVMSDDGTACALFSGPRELKIVDVHAAIEREQREKDAERKHRLEEEQKKAAAEQMAADERSRAQAAITAAARLRARLAKPTWADYEDLDDLLARFPGGPNSALENFVRYGTPELALKADKGDRFDREEALEAAAEHRQALAARQFYLQRSYQWDERESSPARRGTIRLRVPIGFRCEVPDHDATVGVATYSEHPQWFLTKEGKLRPCVDPQQARLVEESDGILYLPDLQKASELVVWVAGDREVQKRIARAPDQHVINVGVTHLRLERLQTEGFYKWDAIRSEDYTSGAIMRAFQKGINGPEGQPNYFVTRERNAPDDTSLPEVVLAAVDKVEVVDVSGKDRTVVFSWSGK